MAASIMASEKGIEIVKQARKKKGWNVNSAAWSKLANTSTATIKRFLVRKAIQQPAFIGICKAVDIEHWEEIVDNNPTSKNSQVDFFSYDYSWVGRENLVAELTNKVQSSYRILMLVGISGIGKTALAERLAVELQEDSLNGDWTKFVQQNFENEQQTSDFASVATRWLEKLGKTITQEQRKDTQQLLNLLLKQLQENRYIVLIDSLENILKGNEEEGWNNFQDEWWVRFFESLLASESCQSRIILTSQDLPQQMPTRYHNFWHCQVLSGLTKSEQLELFEKTGLEVSTDSANRPYLERIGAAYEGHPLALRVIAGENGSNPFYGNVIAYWNKYGIEIEEVEKAIEEAKTRGIIASVDDRWRLDRYTRELKKRVRSRLEKTFNRLKEDFYYSYVLLCEASVYRLAVQENFWLSHLEDWDCDKEKQKLALDTLRDRYLVEEVVEENQLLLRQHNLIRSVALEHLKQLD
jgi:SpoVK/Ycf46/Vps4 family AAA+-type ATPase